MKNTSISRENYAEEDENGIKKVKRANEQY